MPSQGGISENQGESNTAGSATTIGAGISSFSGGGVKIGGEANDNQIHRNYDHLDHQKVTDDYVGHNNEDEEAQQTSF